MFDKIFVELHKAYENVDYEFSTNGEAACLRTLAESTDTRSVFDVGANVGDWSATAVRIFPQATVHAFEIVPDTFERLAENSRDEARIVPHNFGLSDAEGTTKVYFAPELSHVATCVPGFSDQFHDCVTREVDAAVTTGDTFCAENGIAKIDFLKIDVEGYEDRVLKGFEGMLSRGAIDVIQFEYGYINIDTHFLLRDFYTYLEGFGMRLGKIYPTNVDFRDYRHVDEDFYGPNYLAVRSSCAALIEALGRR